MTSLCGYFSTKIYLIVFLAFIFNTNAFGMDISKKIEDGFHINMKGIKDMLSLRSDERHDTIQNVLNEPPQGYRVRNVFVADGKKESKDVRKQITVKKYIQTKRYKLNVKPLAKNTKQAKQFVMKIENVYRIEQINILHNPILMDISSVKEIFMNNKRAVIQRRGFDSILKRMTQMHSELEEKLMKLKGSSNYLIHEVGVNNKEYNLQDMKHDIHDRKKRATYNYYHPENHKWNTNTWYNPISSQFSSIYNEHNGLNYVNSGFSNGYVSNHFSTDGINFKNSFTSNLAFPGSFTTIHSSPNSLTPVYST